MDTTAISPIAVFARFRPPNIDHADMSVSLISSSSRGKLFGNNLSGGQLIDYTVEPALASDGTVRNYIGIRVPEDADPGLFHNNPSGRVRFEFDKVFDAKATQETIFNEVVKRKILEAFLGVNCTVFAYGQTGSGKTFTVSGGDSFHERGLIPRSIGLLFEEMNHRIQVQSHAFKCRISFAEVYKENVYDLLDPKQRELPLKSRTPVQVLESSSGLVMKNISVYDVSEEKDALSLFFMGISNRIVDATAMNSVSSRSHAIFTALVDSESQVDGRKIFTSGKINLVDLAGSERMYKMHNTRGLITEAKSINLSLHYLEQVIVALRDQAKSDNPPGHKSTHGSSSTHTAVHHAHIPYRNSVLTSILRDSLGGNCKSCFVLTLSAERVHFEETVSTCRFGQRCGEVRVAVTANTEVSLIDQLREQAQKIKSLERQVMLLEESKKQGLEAIRTEQELRRSMCEHRSLTEDEKNVCKTNVNFLLTAAKRSLGILNAPSNSLQPAAGSMTASIPPSPHAQPRDPLGHDVSRTTKQVSDEVLDESQDELYKAVCKLDKAVVVELCSALGALVQRIYMEKEKIKSNYQLRSTILEHRLAAAGGHADTDTSDAAKEPSKTSAGTGKNDDETERSDQSSHSATKPLSPSLDSESTFGALVTRGEYFSKENRFGIRSSRFVAVSRDFLLLYWHHMNNVNHPTSIPITDFARYVSDHIDSLSRASHF